MSESIVVVDDERIILELTSMILTSKGYRVLTAVNPLEGLALVAREKPALVLLDYMMPRMDGMSVLRKIRQEFPDTYVIMFTGKGSEEIAVELMKAGASDYILKPFNNQDLAERIENVLRLRRIELHNRELKEDRERLLREVEEWNLELERRVEEKSLELERAHAEILQAEKLAALGHLSAGMAHEIRNPLNSISLFSQVLKGGLEEDTEKVGYADKILAEVDRIDGILVRLLAASSRSHVTMQPVQIEDVLQQALSVFGEQIRLQKVHLHLTVQPDLPPVSADPGEVEQIFSNLLANSLYEMPEGGGLTIELRAAGATLEIHFTDSGPGIPEENLSKIFDPFFTTKSKGTGFGLSVVLRIIKSCGGKISVQSRPGKGTTFLIQLPTC